MEYRHLSNESISRCASCLCTVHRQPVHCTAPPRVKEFPVLSTCTDAAVSRVRNVKTPQLHTLVCLLFCPQETFETLQKEVGGLGAVMEGGSSAANTASPMPKISR